MVDPFYESVHSESANVTLQFPFKQHEKSCEDKIKRNGDRDEGKRGEPDRGRHTS